MRVLISFCHFIVLSFTGIAVAQTSNVAPAGTGRVGSAEVQMPTPSETPRMTSVVWHGDWGCVAKAKQFTIDDPESSFKSITYVDGKIRIESRTNAPVEISCEMPKDIQDKTSWSPVKEKISDWKSISLALIKTATSSTRYTLTNKNEVPVDSTIDVNTHGTSNLTLIYLNNRVWNGSRIRVVCPKSNGDTLEVAVINGKGTPSVAYSARAALPNIAPPEPPGVEEQRTAKCPLEYYNINIAQENIKSSKGPAAGNSSTKGSGPATRKGGAQ